ncbi:hypothetical protein SLS57_008344 [Botryosphaeria dothidea]
MRNFILLAGILGLANACDSCEEHDNPPPPPAHACSKRPRTTLVTSLVGIIPSASPSLAPIPTPDPSFIFPSIFPTPSDTAEPTAVSSGAPVATTCPNLVTNGDFSQTLDGWTATGNSARLPGSFFPGYGVAALFDPATGGTNNAFYAGLSIPDRPAANLTHFDLNTEANVIYTLSLKLNARDSGTAYFACDYLSIASTFPPAELVVSTVFEEQVVPASGQWTTLTGTFSGVGRPQVGSVSQGIRCRFSAGSTTVVRVFVDDVSVSAC